MKNTILHILFIIISISIYSQNVVVDKINKQSIPNVNITIKNTNKGFVTDSNGVFYIKNNLKKGDILVFTALGYEPKEVIFENNIHLQEVSLTRKTENLQEVILSSKSKEKELIQLGVYKHKNRFWRIAGKGYTLATLVNSINRRDDGIIKSLIFKKLKVKFTGTQLVDLPNKCPKYKNVRIKNKIAVKLQLYAIDKKTKLPNTNKPLINDNIVILLKKNTNKLEFDISKYNISMPENGVFVTLKIIEAYKTNSKTDFLKRAHVLMYNISGNTNDAVSYYKTDVEGYGWIKDKTGNAIFSLKVSYPIN